MVFAKEQHTEEDALIDRLTERPVARAARIRRKQVDPEFKRAVSRLLAEDLDLSPEDLVYRARMAVNAAKGGRARAKALMPARRRAIAKHAAAARRSRPMAKGREWGRLYKQRNSRFWWYCIGFQGRIICQSTKTSDKRVTPLPENVREGFCNRAEVAGLLRHLPTDLHDFVWFGFLTGWRKGEIASLKWADVDAEARTVRLSWRKSKNKQARTMALEGELAAIIKRQSIARAERVLRGHDSPYVFVRAATKTRNTRSRGKPVDDLRVVWKRACQEAGLEGRLFHDLRRSAARNMDRAGVSRHVAMQITGHKTESMYRRYNIVTESDIRAALAKTQTYLDTLPTTSR